MIFVAVFGSNTPFLFDRLCLWLALFEFFIFKTFFLIENLFSLTAQVLERLRDMMEIESTDEIDIMDEIYDELERRKGKSFKLNIVWKTFSI